MRTVRITIDGTTDQIANVLCDIERSLEANGGGHIQQTIDRAVTPRDDTLVDRPIELSSALQSP